MKGLADFVRALNNLFSVDAPKLEITGFPCTVCSLLRILDEKFILCRLGVFSKYIRYAFIR